ncbi:MAG TPA: sigma-54 dependent transcriptional regulator [Planctomycetota bacterium]|jgi:DNA-binding NtrC family response regulator
MVINNGKPQSADAWDISSAFRVMVVDDAADLRKTYADGLKMLGYEVWQAGSGAEALQVVRNQTVDAAVVDLHMPGMDGLSLLKTMKEQHSDVEVLIVTGFGTIPSAVEAMRLGAYDYIAKPFSFEELDQRLKRCVQARELRRENMRLRGLLREKYHYENLVGKCEPMKQVFRMIRQVAQSRATVLLQGKSGTGKELVARAIHFNSAVAAGPMVTVDCGAIAPTVIESELFGHVKGAFTGAHQSKEGLFRMANGGTLFFDEIGELPLEMQTKLLRTLQEREVRPVGSDRSYPVDVRIVAATHRELDAGVKAGTFREDLFYRLNVITIAIPPLSDRKEDIPLLLAHFLKKHSRNDRPVQRVDGQAMKDLLSYGWPGNVRELENTVERALALGHGPVVLEADLPPHIVEAGGRPSRVSMPAVSLNAAEASTSQASLQPVQRPEAPTDMVLAADSQEDQAAASGAILAPPSSGEAGGAAGEALFSGRKSLDEVERQAILATLRITGGDRTACARILGIDKSTLYRKLKRYDLETKEDDADAGNP